MTDDGEGLGDTPWQAIALEQVDVAIKRSLFSTRGDIVPNFIVCRSYNVRLKARRR